MTRPLDKCVTKETKQVERGHNRMLSLSLSPFFLPLPAVCCIMWLFVYRCNGVKNTPSGFIPAAVVCPQAPPPASAATASGFLPPVLPPTPARWRRSAQLKASSPESKHGPATKRKGAEISLQKNPTALLNWQEAESFKNLKKRGETTPAATYCTYFEYCGQPSSRFVFASLCKCQMLTITLQQLRQTEHFYVAHTTVDHQNRNLRSLFSFDCHLGYVHFFPPQERNLRIKQKQERSQEFVQQGKTLL